MNERIQELHEQAMKSCDQYRDQPLIYHRMYREKFAELIVRESVKFYEDNSGYDECNNVWFPDPEDLLGYFGIEE